MFPQIAFIFKVFVSFTEDCTLQSETFIVFIYSFTGTNFTITNQDEILTLTGTKPANFNLYIQLTESQEYIFSFDCKVHCYAGGSVSNQVNRFRIKLGDIMFQRDVGAVSNYTSNPFPYNQWFHVELHKQSNSVYAIINGVTSNIVSLTEEFTNILNIFKWSDGSLYNAGDVFLTNFRLEQSLQNC